MDANIYDTILKDIIQSLGIPKEVIDAKDTNYSTAKFHYDQFLDRTSPIRKQNLLQQSMQQSELQDVQHHPTTTKSSV